MNFTLKYRFVIKSKRKKLLIQLSINFKIKLKLFHI
jgi:hypothetical protein